MKLQNFEEYIDDVILKRGKKYFADGHIEKMEELENNFYIFQVMGSDNYTVTMNIDENDKIMNFSCDCPYDLGEHCKHQVAALYSLRQKKLETDQPKQNKKVKASNKVDLKTTLSNLERVELIQTIINLSNDFPEIEKRLLFTYAPIEDEIAASKKLMREYINQYKKRGFIHWNHVYDALQGVDMTLTKAHEKIENGESESAVLLGLAVLPIVMNMFDFCDDSGGCLGGEINESIQMIYEAVTTGVNQMTDQLKGKLFTLLMKEALHSRYDGWTDWRISILRCVIVLCDTKARRDKLGKQLNLILEMNSKDSWSSKYVLENIKLLQLELIETFDGKEQALEFIRENIKLSPFREKMIHYSLEKGDYSDVIALCEEGEVVDREYRGLVSMWKKYKLQAYEGLGNIKKQRELILQFIYDNEFSYYSSFKRLYEPEEWNNILEEILHSFEKQAYQPNVYTEILKEEKLANKILKYCMKHLSSIKELSPYIMEEYEEEVKQLYIKYIELESENARDRRQYRNVCSLIKDFKKICGASNAQMLIDKLKENYIRRPAFIDELGKVK